MTATDDAVEVLEAGPTDRWRGLAAGALVAVLAGVFARSAALLALAAVGAVLAAYARTASAPAVTLAVDRRLDPPDPGVGEPVTVELTVRNVGDRTLPDVRIADGVPSGATVARGDPRRATALGASAAATVRYEIEGGAREAAFAPVRVALRDVAGVVERRARIRCEDRLAWPATTTPDLPGLQPRRAPTSGQLPVDEGGDGLAFHAVREHRPGDPLHRIDWRRLARTGEVATVEFRPERTATVVLAIDVRAAARVAPAPDAATAIERSAAAASALVDGLGEAGHAVGLATVGEPSCRVPPGRGDRHRQRIRDRLADHPAFARDGRKAERSEGERDDPDGSDHSAVEGSDGRSSVAAARLSDRLPADATVVVCSPLCDDGADAFVRGLAARPVSVSVLSPDPTANGTAGRDLVRLERAERLRSLRATGVPVVDWPQDASLERVLARASGGGGAWSSDAARATPAGAEGDR